MNLERARKPVCPVATAFVFTWESGLADPDRRRLVGPLRARLSGAPSGTGMGQRRAALATDWLVRTCAPVWLELAGPDPVALAGLRTCPPIPEDPDTRAGRVAIDRAVRATVAARMAACNTAWSRTRPLCADQRAMAERVVERVLPTLLEAFGHTGFDAAIAAASRAPCTNRWPVLRDHLLGLAQAAASSMAWQAVWDTRAAAEDEAAWINATMTSLRRELGPLEERLQPNAFALGMRLLA